MLFFLGSPSSHCGTLQFMYKPVRGSQKMCSLIAAAQQGPFGNSTFSSGVLMYVRVGMWVLVATGATVVITENRGNWAVVPSLEQRLLFQKALGCLDIPSIAIISLKFQTLIGRTSPPPPRCPSRTRHGYLHTEYVSIRPYQLCYKPRAIGHIVPKPARYYAHNNTRTFNQQ